MLYFLAQYLDSIDLPGAGLWTYVSFRSLMALMLSLVISMWMGKSFITYMKKKRHLEKARDAEIDPYGVKKIGVPSMGGIVIITAILLPALLLGRLTNVYVLLLLVTVVWLGLLGFLADKIGIRNGIIILAILNAIGFACIFLFLGDNTIPMLIGGFGVGVADAQMSVGLPLLTRECFGDRCYGEIYSYMNMPIAVLGGLGATFVAVVANVTGSFTNAYACGIVFAAVIVLLTILATSTAKKFKDKWTLEGEPEASRH